MSDNDVVILQGLADDDRVMLSPPPGHEKLALVPLGKLQTPIAKPGSDKPAPPTKVEVRTPAVTDTHPADARSTTPAATKPVSASPVPASTPAKKP